MSCLALALTLHLASFHTDPGFNNANYGAGLDCRVTEAVTLSVGGYRNSYFHNSAYATAAIEQGGKFRYGLMAGVASGYPDHKVQPLGGVTLGYNLGPATVRVLFLPAAIKRSGMAHLMLQIPIERGNYAQ